MKKASTVEKSGRSTDRQKSSETITRDAWLEALAEAEGIRDDPTLLTIRDLMTVWGCCKTKTQNLVTKLLENKKAEKDSKMIRTSTGTVVRVPAYRLLK